MLWNIRSECHKVTKEFEKNTGRSTWTIYKYEVKGFNAHLYILNI